MRGVWNGLVLSAPIWVLIVLLIVWLAGCTEEITTVECLAVVMDGDTIGYVAADSTDELAREHCVMPVEEASLVGPWFPYYGWEWARREAWGDDYAERATQEGR